MHLDRAPAKLGASQFVCEGNLFSFRTPLSAQSLCTHTARTAVYPFGTVGLGHQSPSGSKTEPFARSCLRTLWCLPGPYSISFDLILLALLAFAL